MRGRKLSYGKMCEDIRAQIGSGEFAPGAGLPSENQLALKYSICRSSVRTGLVSLEQENLIGRHAGKGWFVRVADSSFLSSDSSVFSKLYTIAADLNFLAVPWYHQIIFDGIREACSDHCVRQVFYDPQNLSSMREGFCDGLICALSGTYGGMKENPILSRLPDLGIHPVVVNRFYENPKIGYVSCDYCTEAQHGAEFLKSIGADKVCYVKGIEDSSSLKARELGILRCYSDDQIIHCNMPIHQSAAEYASRLGDWFKENGIPDYLYLENGSFGAPLFRAFQKMGVRENSAPVIFCFDDISYLQEYYDYPVSYLRMPLERMMKDAVNYLIARIDDPTVPVLKKLYHAEIKYCNTKTIETVLRKDVK